MLKLTKNIFFLQAAIRKQVLRGFMWQCTATLAQIYLWQLLLAILFDYMNPPCSIPSTPTQVFSIHNFDRIKFLNSIGEIHTLLIIVKFNQWGTVISRIASRDSSGIGTYRVSLLALIVPWQRWLQSCALVLKREYTI